MLPAETEKVGVFVGDSVGGIESKRRIVHQARLTAIQVYSAPRVQTLRDWLGLNIKVIVAWPADRIIRGRLGGSEVAYRGGGQSPRPFSSTPAVVNRSGGTGKPFDWAKAATVLSAIDGFDFVAAGGLTPQNVGGAIGILKPWGVDVVSGVEASPGKKDPEKVRAFVRAVRECDRKTG